MGGVLAKIYEEGVGGELGGGKGEGGRGRVRSVSTRNQTTLGFPEALALEFQFNISTLGHCRKFNKSISYIFTS